MVTVNGNHQKASKRTAKADRSAFRQLARGSERAEHSHLAEWNTTPCLLMSTELLAPDGITVNALQAPGKGLLPARPATGRRSADAVPSERNLAYAGAVKVPADGHGARIQDGFFIPRKELGWYGQLLARTGAAGQLAFAGAGTEIAQYLTGHPWATLTCSEVAGTAERAVPMRLSDRRRMWPGGGRRERRENQAISDADEDGSRVAVRAADTEEPRRSRAATGRVRTHRVTADHDRRSLGAPLTDMSEALGLHDMASKIARARFRLRALHPPSIPRTCLQTAACRAAPGTHARRVVGVTPIHPVS
ncbi:hypothetical protein ACWD6K_15570, partial [Streptomyces sp. NPDC002431]